MLEEGRDGVVGTSTAVCFPSAAALKAARTAISCLAESHVAAVISLSIGRGDSMSAFTAWVALSWSGSVLVDERRLELVLQIESRGEGEAFFLFA